LSGCHTWAENYDDLMVMVKEAIEGWLEVSHEKNYLKFKSVPFSRRLNYN